MTVLGLRRCSFLAAVLGLSSQACSSDNAEVDKRIDHPQTNLDAGADEGSASDAAPGPSGTDQDAAADADAPNAETPDAETPPSELDASDQLPDVSDSGVGVGSADASVSVEQDAAISAEPDAAAATPQSPDGGELPDVPAGSVPPQLAGVWQQTRAQAADQEFDDGFGGSFSLTSGFSVQLKITPDGSYYFAHYASGKSSSCVSVSQLDQSVGSAVLVGDTLTLYPQQRVIENTSCEDSRVDEVGTEPIVLHITLGEDQQYNGGMRSYLLTVEGFSHPLELTSLFRVPDYEPFEPEQPSDFVLGEVGAYEELQGLWAADAGSDVDFYDPETGEFYWPELNGSPHRWIRFDADGYEIAVALQNVNDEGVCESDLIYYERGTARFQVTEDVGGLGDHFVGHTRFDATDSRLIVNIRECDQDDGVLNFDLQPVSSYYAFTFYTDSPKMLALNCSFERSEWQSLLCDRGIAGYYER